MIHAWCYAKFRDTGHGPRFKRKLRECGLRSIYHELGNVAPLKESSKRYILRCERCAFEVLRRAGRGGPRAVRAATNVALTNAFRSRSTRSSRCAPPERRLTAHSRPERPRRSDEAHLLWRPRT